MPSSSFLLFPTMDRPSAAAYRVLIITRTSLSVYPPSDGVLPLWSPAGLSPRGEVNAVIHHRNIPPDVRPAFQKSDAAAHGREIIGEEDGGLPVDKGPVSSRSSGRIDHTARTYSSGDLQPSLCSFVEARQSVLHHRRACRHG